MPDTSDFMAQAKAQMESWTEEMKQMQAKMMEAQAAGQEQLVKQMEALNEQRKHAEAHMEELGKANLSAWKDMQDTMEKAWKDMEKSMDEARKMFLG